LTANTQQSRSGATHHDAQRQTTTGRCRNRPQTAARVSTVTRTRFERGRRRTALHRPPPRFPNWFFAQQHLRALLPIVKCRTRPRIPRAAKKRPDSEDRFFFFPRKRIFFSLPAGSPLFLLPVKGACEGAKPRPRSGGLCRRENSREATLHLKKGRWRKTIRVALERCHAHPGGGSRGSGLHQAGDREVK